MADDRFNRTASGAGWVNPTELPKGPNGRALCRTCGTETAPPRRTFCSDACVDWWRIRHDPEFAKARVFERDRGICVECSTDTIADIRHKLPELPVPRGKRVPRRFLSRFDMDHIVPVVEGGGSCGLENLRTLCKPCHRKATAALAKRRAEARRASAPLTELAIGEVLEARDG